MSNTVKSITILCGIVFICFFVIKAIYKPFSSFDEKELNVDEVLPEGVFITEGNWTVFKYEFIRSSFFDIGLVPKILDRFEKEHPELCVQNGDWEVVFNQINSRPYGILFRHYPTNSGQIKQ